MNHVTRRKMYRMYRKLAPFFVSAFAGGIFAAMFYFAQTSQF